MATDEADPLIASARKLAFAAMDYAMLGRDGDLDAVKLAMRFSWRMYVSPRLPTGSATNTRLRATWTRADDASSQPGKGRESTWTSTCRVAVAAAEEPEPEEPQEAEDY
ncbi:hypothetical protein, partial [Mycobacterium sp.]|uniref:hypothetical protein n=1 Tax=Mycobacterium sp. TaxID=1785 RepID=UPI003C7200C7